MKDLTGCVVWGALASVHVFGLYVAFSKGLGWFMFAFIFPPAAVFLGVTGLF